VLPKVRCFKFAELQSMITHAAPCQLLESEPAGENANPLLIVARKA